jgi:ABC-type multidrug transport system ATPase subunit
MNNKVTALSVSGLKKSYGIHEVISNLDLQIHQGSIHGLVGLNGSGKTTSLECILGLQSVNSGDISILNYSPKQLHRANGDIIAIFDSPSLLPNLTVRQCMQHASLLCETPKRSPALAEQLLSIERFSNFKIKHLSLGNKRRASIAHALIGNPKMIILDEPFNGLDAEGVDDVLQLIKTLNKEEGTTFLLSSHQLPYLEQICSHIAILNKGSIAINDKIEALLAQSSCSVLLQTDQQETVIKLLENGTFAKVAIAADPNYLQVTLNSIDSSQLNKMLVDQNISINELILNRASLGSLFREITREAPR